MTLRNALVTTLLLGDQYGLQLHGEVVARSARITPWNVGQVYATLDRLAAAGLVRVTGATADGLTTYGLTPAGRLSAEEWCTLAAAPLDWNSMQEQILLVSTLPGVDVAPLVEAHRAAWAGAEPVVDDLGAQAALRRAALLWLDGLDGLAGERLAGLRARQSGLTRGRPRRGRRPAV